MKEILTNMLMMILYPLIFILICAILIIIGEYFSNKYPNSKFNKWWNKNVVTKMPDNYDE